MKKPRTVLALALLSALIITAFQVSLVAAQWTGPIWEGDVLSYCSPLVTTPMALEFGREYLIEVKGAFVSSNLGGTFDFAADAQYYTDSANPPGTMAWWVWNPALTYPAPGGHSFLQINGMDVNWGLFSNGDLSWGGHEYAISYIGMGAPITFQIVDWIDDDCTLNSCTLHVKIYEGPYVPVGETAFAYGGDYAKCFKYWSFKNWGWSNGPLGPNYYEFPIYAGAAKCDITKGTLVGTLYIAYDGSTAIVTYMMDSDWTMGFAQLYVDGEPLPRDGKGDFTVSPGQFPYKYYVDGPAHTFTVPGLSGDIYVVAHADVFGPP